MITLAFCMLHYKELLVSLESEVSFTDRLWADLFTTPSI